MSRIGVAVLLVLAWAVRLFVVFTEDAYLHPDALHQALEPAYGLVHGHFQVAWEFEQGIRSYVWPGLIAVPLWLTKAFGLHGVDRGTDPGLIAVGALVSAIDAITVVLAARITHLVTDRDALATWTVGLLLALHPAVAVAGAQPLVGIGATALLVGAVWRTVQSPDTTRGAAGWGALCMATALLRIQLLPAVLVIVGFVVAKRGFDRPRWVAAAAAATAVLAAFALVDLATWGAPLSSLVGYLRFSLTAASDTFGHMPAGRYWRDFGAALPGLRVVLLVGAAFGVRRAPLPAAVVAAVVLPHQFVGHKEWRFVHAGLVLLIPAFGVGLAALHLRITERRGLRRALVASIAIGSSAAVGWAWATDAIWRTTWLFNQGATLAIDRSRALNRAYRTIARWPAPPRVVQGVLPASGAAGHALLGHDVEVIHMIGAAAPVQTPPAGTAVILPGVPVPGAPPPVWMDTVSGIMIIRTGPPPDPPNPQPDPR